MHEMQAGEIWEKKYIEIKYIPFFHRIGNAEVLKAKKSFE